MSFPKLKSPDDVIKLVEDVGFVPFMRNEILGFSIEEAIDKKYWFPDEGEGVWEWKGPIIRSSGCAYGKLMRNKAVFVSPAWYLDLANVRRDGYDFDARFDDGLTSLRDKRVYDTLEKSGPMLSKDLKEFSGYGRDGFKGFDPVVTRLQMQGYVLISDFVYPLGRDGRPYGWGLTQYDTPERLFGPDFSDHVYDREPEESRERIVEHLCRLFPDNSVKTIRRLVG